MTDNEKWVMIVWERLNKTGKWCTYSAEVSQLLEQSYRKYLTSAYLGDADPNLQRYTVNLTDMIQISDSTGTKCSVRRKVCDDLTILSQGFIWQWHGDGDEWNTYDIDVNNFIETSFIKGEKTIKLNKNFPGYNYEIDFTRMLQINKRTKRKRSIRREHNANPYPVERKTASKVAKVSTVQSGSSSNNGLMPDLNEEVPGTAALERQVNQYIRNVQNPIDCSANDECCSVTSDERARHSNSNGSICDATNCNGKVSTLSSTQMVIVNSQLNSLITPMVSFYEKSLFKSNKEFQLIKSKFVNMGSKFSALDSSSLFDKCISSFYPDSSAGQPVKESAANSVNNTAALVNGKPWMNNWPPDTPDHLLKPVPGIDPLPEFKVTKGRKKKLDGAFNKFKGDVNVLDKYTAVVKDISSFGDENCIICCELLSHESSYNKDATVVKLILCSHMFHKACLDAMQRTKPKDIFMQCPTCKQIHGEKCGIQPPGSMVYHVLPYSLPGYPDYETIRIIYDIRSGTQGPEHPNPGKKYTARGFPRHCYLPDNEMGRKVLRLLVKAWNRRLIFTIGRSSTTGEENTVTWNEIHHKTEFGFNRRGHGYPDPNYFENILAELAAHGVVDEVYEWYPA